MPLAHELRGLLESLSELTAQHVRLVRIELQDDARWYGVRFGVIAGLAPMVLVGYMFLCVAAAWGLSELSSWPVALVVVGLGNLAVGAAGISWAVGQLKGRQVMADSLEELEATSALVTRKETDPT